MKETPASVPPASKTPQGTEVGPGVGQNPSPEPQKPSHVSTGSNTSPPSQSQPPPQTQPQPQPTSSSFQPVSSQTETPQTFPTTIPSHPSTIQYIPLIPANPTSQIRATLHLIRNDSASSSSSHERGTIHYPPHTVPVQIIQSVPPLIVTSATVQTEEKKVVQIIQQRSSSTSTSTSPPQSSPRNVSVQLNIRSESSSETNPPQSPLSDQHIRVLTPSEIMRTLPSLAQEAYDPPSNSNTVRYQHECCSELILVIRLSFVRNVSRSFLCSNNH